MMSNNTVVERQTKYCQAIESLLKSLGHATNADILNLLRVEYPNLSATTVHRATARMASREMITVAPPASDGSMRYDGNTKPHDHFQCTSCGILRDTDIKEKVIPILESTIGDCQISGRLNISGICKKCKEIT